MKAGRKPGVKVGRYYKSCFFSSAVSASAGKRQVAHEYIYPFTAEYKSETDFFGDYAANSDLYDFLDQNGCPCKTIPLPGTLPLRPQANNQAYCDRCRAYGSKRDDRCSYRDYLSQEHVLRIAIRDKARDAMCLCKKCGKAFANYAKNESSTEISLQDVRLNSRPTCLVVTRRSLKCSNCGTLQREPQLVGFQAYCDGKMSCRLAENVLYAHLSSVKREHIAEAYGLSKSQVDRIRQRLIDQSLSVRARHVKPIIADNAGKQVERRTVRDPRTGQLYYFYFLMRSATEAVLIHFLTEQERDALPIPYDDARTFAKLFPDPNEFFLACYCCLAGERGMRDAKLLDSLERLEQWYQGRFSEKRPDAEAGRVFFFDSMEKVSLNKLDLFALLLRDPAKSESEQFDIAAYGQYVLSEFGGAQASGDGAYGEIERFLSQLMGSLRRHKIRPKALKERLLLVNPARVTQLELDLLTGKRQKGLDTRAFMAEGLYMIRPSLGAPVQCLTHFLENGLLDPKPRQLLPCALTHGIQTAEDGTTRLPCGLCGAGCPHRAADVDF